MIFHLLVVFVWSVRVQAALMFCWWEATWQFFSNTLKIKSKLSPGTCGKQLHSPTNKNSLHRCILANYFHVNYQKCLFCTGFWEISYQLAKVEPALMGSSWPQVSFLKDDYVVRSKVCSPLAIWFSGSSLWLPAKVKFCQCIVAWHSVHTFFLQLCHMSNPLTFKQQQSLVSVCLSWIWTTITSPFVQWKILACLLQNLPNSLAFMVFRDS